MRLSAKILASVLFLSGANLKAAPDLSNQRGWSFQDKKEFLQQLESNQPMPTGEVQYWQTPARDNLKQARFLSLSLGYEGFYCFDSEEKLLGDTQSFSSRLVYGWHLFSWVRFYAGLGYSKFEIPRPDATPHRIAHWKLPVAIELALIPLGTPHTRYVLLRFGANLHYFKEEKRSDDDAPTLNLGTRRSYNIGVGYEWQIAESNWRINTVLEGYQTVEKINGKTFQGISAVTGIGLLL